MPIYLKQCNHCEHEFEITCKFSERDDTRTCPQCFSDDLKNLINYEGGYKFIGKGFYATEYGSQQGNYGRFKVPWDSDKREIKK